MNYSAAGDVWDLGYKVLPSTDPAYSRVLVFQLLLGNTVPIRIRQTWFGDVDDLN